MLLSASFVFHGWPETFLLRRYVITPRHHRLEEVLREVPPEASVWTQRRIAPHVSHRRGLYRFLEGEPAGGARPDLVILDRSLIDRDNYRKPFEDGVAMLPARGYEKTYEGDSILVLSRAPAPRAP